MDLHLAGFIFFIGTLLPIVCLLVRITKSLPSRKFVFIRYGFTIFTGSWLFMSFFVGDWLSLSRVGRETSVKFGFFAFQLNTTPFYYHSALVDYNRAKSDQVYFTVCTHSLSWIEITNNRLMKNGFFITSCLHHQTRLVAWIDFWYWVELGSAANLWHLVCGQLQR